jgi:hypothetical protein
VAFGHHQIGCRALQGHYGVGALLSVAIWEEMGDCRRFGSSSDAVRHAGLDITVWASDSKRAQGHLARQGPAILRWALYEVRLAAAKRPRPPRRTTATTSRSATAWGPIGPPSRSVESSAGAASTPFGNWARTPWRRPPDQPPPCGHGACLRCCRRLLRCYCRRGSGPGRPERNERRQPPSAGYSYPPSCDRSSVSAHRDKSGRPTATRDRRAARPLPLPGGDHRGLTPSRPGIDAAIAKVAHVGQTALTGSLIDK